jgi:hypothetical protein
MYFLHPQPLHSPPRQVHPKLIRPIEKICLEYKARSCASHAACLQFILHTFLQVSISKYGMYMHTHPTPHLHIHPTPSHTPLPSHTPSSHTPQPSQTPHSKHSTQPSHLPLPSQTSQPFTHISTPRPYTYTPSSKTHLPPS